jgi:4-amino-4-deoxy-L-arabinose transferase-like glycosyltransferase
VSVGTAAPRLAGGRARTRAAERSLAPVWAGVAALTALAALLRFYRIGHQGFWFDEANTALLVHFSPGKMLGLIPQSESTPPLYYCAAWVWARVFGYGEAALRSLSAVCGVATVPVAYGAGRRLISERAGLIAAALTAFSPVLVWYSQEARSYAMLVLLASASLLAFAHLLERPRAAAAAAWVIASALALATHYYAVLIVIPEAAWLVWAHRHRRPVTIAVAIIALCGLALIPLAVSQNGTGHSSWIAHADLVRRIKEIAPQFVAGFDSPAYGVLEPIALVLAGLGLALLIPRSARPGRRGALLAGGIALAGLVLALLLVAVGFDDLLTRNVLALWMPAAVAVAGGFALSRPRLLGVGAAVALCAIGVVGSVGVARDRNLQRPDWRGVAAVLGAHPRSGLRAIMVQHYRDLLPLSLYVPELKFLRGRGRRVSELDIVSFTSPSSAGFCWWGSACNLWPSRMQASYAIPGFHAVWRRHVHQFTVLHLVSDGRPAFVSAAAVSRALHTTRLRNDELLIQR